MISIETIILLPEAINPSVTKDIGTHIGYQEVGPTPQVLMTPLPRSVKFL